MADNGTPIADLKVAIVKDVELKTSKAGKAFVNMNMVHEEGGEKTWFTGLAFGNLARKLATLAKKGSKMKILSGTVKTKEYVSDKTGKPGTENVITLNHVLLSSNNEVSELDEFSV